MMFTSSPSDSPDVLWDEYSVQVLYDLYNFEEKLYEWYTEEDLDLIYNVLVNSTNAGQKKFIEILPEYVLGYLLNERLNSTYNGQQPYGGETVYGFFGKVVYEDKLNEDFSNNPNILQYFAEQGSWETQTLVAHFIDILPETVEYLLGHSLQPYVLKALADNPNVSNKILAQLAVSLFPSVRHKVANNRNVSLSTLKTLVNDTDPETRILARQKFLELSQTRVSSLVYSNNVLAQSTGETYSNIYGGNFFR